MGKLSGKVCLITGAARGQGRSHAVRFAQEGADIIAVDICRQMDTVAYSMASPEDMAQTVAEVEALDRRIVHAEVDVRDVAALKKVVEHGAAELGGLHVVVANAGISTNMDPDVDQDLMFREVVEVNLLGTWNTVRAAAPLMIEAGEGGSVVLTSSALGLSGRNGDGGGSISGYIASKHAIVGLMRAFCHWLAPHNIRVNSVHPAVVNTPMAVNEAMEKWSAANPAVAETWVNLLPVPMVEPVDISNAIAWLVSDEGRYVTGVTLPVDAGFAAK
ncbi:mycofactocin-coupled SDR family oxidoreductase [Pseudonocardia spinosispora]|uniref:mycofactocin-coupled SDR family oxidoreductase n=1 Tax=Pseudonocardia spinosispora TaxID=103441 RepID=UPI00048FB060|nr:mycofactocin-coupled SDR family oxidoreductase [Pseudonocardia spinosispora]